MSRKAIFSYAIYGVTKIIYHKGRIGNLDVNLGVNLCYIS